MDENGVPEKIKPIIQSILSYFPERGYRESEILIFYERLRLIDLSDIIKIVDRANNFWKNKEEEKINQLLSETTNLLREISKQYGKENRFSEAFTGLSIDFSKLNPGDTEFSYKLKDLGYHLTEINRIAEFYKKSALELNKSNEYLALLVENGVK